MRKIVITGGAGFIGSHLAEKVSESFPEAQLIILDKMTYAADMRNVLDLMTAERAELVVGDICDYEMCVNLFRDCGLVIHAAAESHVDRSFHSSILFTQTNAVGTHSVMEACRIARVPRIIHVSTDEVYGEVLSGFADETSMLDPTNPYSASKAAAEMIVNGYRHSFKLPVITIRANNVFGTRQYPEKLIPRTIMCLIAGEKLPLHGDGSNVRHFLSALDFAEAIVLLAKKGEIHEIYNIGSPDEFSNKAVVNMICEAFGANFQDSVSFVRDRPFNDRRYAISWEKITRLGWTPTRNLPGELKSMIAWYKSNANHIIRRSRELLRKD